MVHNTYIYIYILYIIMCIYIYINIIYIYVKSCKIPKLYHANLTFSMGRVLVAVAPLCSPPESALPDAELATWRSSSAPPGWWTLLGVLSQLFGVKIRWLYRLACTLIPPTAPANLEVDFFGGATSCSSVRLVLEVGRWEAFLASIS